jgi:hypothetical protein
MNNIKIYIDKLKNILTYKSLKNTELLAKQLLILCKKKKNSLYVAMVAVQPMQIILQMIYCVE